jgi:hypothetical protein
MNTFLDTYDLLKMNQEAIKKLYQNCNGKGTEAVIGGLPIKESPRLDRFTSEFYQSFKELIPMLLK